MSAAETLGILPRAIRYRDAPRYLGMDRGRFDSEVRPYLLEIPIGKQGIAFDRVELDAWWEDYKSRNGRPSKKKGDRLWGANARRASGFVAASGTSKSGSAESRFTKALELARSKKRSGI